MIIKTQIFVTNRTSRNPLWCFIFWNICILRLNILKNSENDYNMHKNGHIWEFWAIFVAGTILPLSEHAWCETDALNSPIWKKSEGFIAPKSPKIEEKNGSSKCYNGHLRPFFSISPYFVLNICFSNQQDFTESTFVLFILKFNDFKTQYPEKHGKCP